MSDLLIVSDGTDVTILDLDGIKPREVERFIQSLADNASEPSHWRTAIVEATPFADVDPDDVLAAVENGGEDEEEIEVANLRRLPGAD